VKLYHYTCHHTRKAMGTRGMLRPSPTFWGPSVLWLTPQATPDRQGLGLTSMLLNCDRLDYRYVVEARDAEPWLESQLRIEAGLDAILALEVGADGARPETWWVLTHSVLGVLDRSYGGRTAKVGECEGRGANAEGLRSTPRHSHALSFFFLSPPEGV
jgi:hypothetical protein